MTPRQAASARALAAAHGHGWARVAATEGMVDPVAIGEAYDRDLAEARSVLGPVIGGYRAPDLDGEDVVHVTATGRLRWRVAADGGARLTVARPGGPCLVADVYASVGAGIVVVVQWADDARVMARHVAAAADAAAALGAPAAELARLWRRFPESLAVDVDEITLGLSGELDPAVVRPAGDDAGRDYLAVVMPMRI